MSSIKIISWNVNGIRAIIKKDFLRDINEIDPDIICLQEVSQNDPETAHGIDQVSELRKLFPDFEFFYGASHDRSGGKDGKRRLFGNLILTRRSPLQVLNHLLPSPADPRARFMARQATEIVISTDFGHLRLLNTHLEFFSEKQSNSNR
mgnify:CR=1 FL=1